MTFHIGDEVRQGRRIGTVTPLSILKRIVMFHSECHPFVISDMRVRLSLFRLRSLCTAGIGRQAELGLHGAHQRRSALYP